MAKKLKKLEEKFWDILGHLAFKTGMMQAKVEACLVEGMPYRFVCWFKGHDWQEGITDTATFLSWIPGIHNLEPEERMNLLRWLPSEIRFHKCQRCGIRRSLEDPKELEERAEAMFD